MTDQELSELDDLAARLLDRPAQAVEPYLSALEVGIATLMDAVLKEVSEEQKKRLVALEYKLRLQRERLLVKQRN